MIFRFEYILQLGVTNSGSPTKALIAMGDFFFKIIYLMLSTYKVDLLEHITRITSLTLYPLLKTYLYLQPVPSVFLISLIK